MKFDTITIEGKSKKKQIEEGYYVKIEYMHGDADGYAKRTWGPFYKGEEDALLRFINMLEKALDAYPNGRGGCDDYVSKVPELKEWLEGYEESVKKECKDCKNNCKPCKIPEIRIGFEWETTPDGWYSDATIEGYSVKYYDCSDNSYHNVKLTKSKK
jgi:hypothetical protein